MTPTGDSHKVTYTTTHSCRDFFFNFFSKIHLNIFVTEQTRINDYYYYYYILLLLLLLLLTMKINSFAVACHNVPITYIHSETTLSQ